MKLFNRGQGEAAPAPTAPEAPAAGAQPPPEAAAAPDPANDPIAAALDQSVREITEKLAKLSSSVEGVREERAQFDEKFGKMEERMRKLTALAEMISSQYNPFLGTEPPARESAVAAVQPVTAAKLAAEVAPHPSRAPPPGPPARATAPAPPPAQPEPAWQKAVPVPEDAPEGPAGPFLQHVNSSFQTSMTLLQWSEMLLKAAGREGLPDLLDYYRALGWIGDDVKALIQTYAKGLRVEKEGKGDWRGQLDLHEKSLVFVEKLRPRRA